MSELKDCVPKVSWGRERGSETGTQFLAFLTLPISSSD